MPFSLSEFRPNPFLRGGHLQTLAGFIAAGTPPGDQHAVLHEVELADGDRIVLSDDRPASWCEGDRVVLLIHGLAGCHASPYMQRIAAKLNARGVRTFRMDLRGCGAGLGLARFPYHSGRSADAAAALATIGRLCPNAPVTLVGFSLGGNITLKLLGETPAALPPNLAQAVAVCPPVDLSHCVIALGSGVNRLYDRYFARLMLQQIAARQRARPDAVVPPGWPLVVANRSNATTSGAARRRPPRGVREFDESFTAPVSGFGTAANYYRVCSSAQFIPAIRMPTLILGAADDPLVPPSPLAAIELSGAVTLQITPSGGHLGFLGRSISNGDGRWMDRRIVEWCCR
ncbi:MAG: alpha/beta fold hydrolase [Planctomycetaceae bacterium]|nr:alpha/beta fold hydrolase [Planctomycetaceae bacterium]